jgi:hypothetical protein
MYSSRVQRSEARLTLALAYARVLFCAYPGGNCPRRSGGHIDSAVQTRGESIQTLVQRPALGRHEDASAHSAVRM